MCNYYYLFSTASKYPLHPERVMTFSYEKLHKMRSRIFTIFDCKNVIEQELYELTVQKLLIKRNGSS